jgi:hypothetical protein
VSTAIAIGHNGIATRQYCRDQYGRPVGAVTLLVSGNGRAKMRNGSCIAVNSSNSHCAAEIFIRPRLNRRRCTGVRGLSVAYYIVPGLKSIEVLTGGGGRRIGSITEEGRC